MKINLITTEEFIEVVTRLGDKLVSLDAILGDDAGDAKIVLIKKMTMLEAQCFALSVEVSKNPEAVTEESMEEFIQQNVNMLNMLLLAGVDCRSLKAVSAEKFSNPFEAFIEASVALRRAVRAFEESEKVEPLTEAALVDQNTDPWAV